jgi:hypothetical protein
VETFRVLAARNGDRTEGILLRLISIENLEETQIAALERTTQVQMKRKEDYDRKIPTDYGIREQGLVLLYDNRHKDFPGKLHTRCGNTDSIFFCSRPQISTKTGSLKFGNK